MATRTFKVEILGDDRRYQRTVDNIDRSTSKLATGFQRLSTGIGIGFAALGGAAIVSGLRGLVDEAREAERVGRITEARIKSTGGAANVTAKDVDRLTTSLSNKVGVDDDLIASGANMLLTFKGVRNEVGRGNDIFSQATRLAVDLAAGMNEGEVSAGGLRTANIQLGKALEDPVRGITALRRAGVSFTEQQKDQIKALVESGRTLDAQKIILKAVGEQFAGTARAASDPLQRLNVRIGNIKETIGQALLPAIERAAAFVDDKLIPAAERWWAKHGPAVRDAFSRIGHVVGTVWGRIENELIPALGDAAKQVDEKVRPALDKMAGAWRDNSDAIKGLKGDLKDLKPLWDFTAFAIGKLANEEIPGFITQIGWIARAWTASKKIVVEANKAVFNAIVGTNQRIIAAAATVAEALHLPMARGLRKAEQRMGEFRRDFNREMDALKDERVNVTARAGITWTAEAAKFRMAAGRMAAGGPVRGPGTATSDSVPIWASHGEHMWSAREVDGVGGHGAMEAMRARARGMAQGGAIEPRLGFEGAVHRDQLDRMTVGLAKGLARAVGTGLTKAMAQAFTGGSGAGFGSGSWMRAIAELRREGVPHNIISTFRSGARTRASGSVSFHALNRAVDLTGPNMLRIWAALTDTNPTELIYSGASRYKSRRGWSPIGQLDPVTLADHWSHVHAAYGKGGRIPEDVFGVGARSGRTYGFHGGETVTPAGAPTIIINVQMAGAIVMGSEREVANRLEPAARAALKAALRREGKQLAEQL